MKKKQSLALILLLGTLSATGPLSLDMYLPALPEMSLAFKSSASMLQLSITTCLFGLALGQLIAGPLSDKIGRKKPLMIGLFIFGLASLLMMLTRNIWLFLLLRFIQGLAGASGQVLSRAVARDLYKGKELTQFYGMLMAVNGIFPIIAPIIGSATLTFTNWVGVFGILAAVGFLLVIWIFFGLKETKPATQVEPANEKLTTGFIELLKNKHFMAITVIQGLIYGALFSYISGSTFVLQTLFGLSPTAFSIVYAINGLGIVLGSVLASRLSQKFANKQVLAGAIILGIIGSLSMVFSLFLPPNIISLLIPLFIVISTVGTVNAVATSIAMDGQKTHAGSASALLGLCMNLFGGIISPVVGLFGTGTYAPMALLIFGCELLAGLILFSTIRASATK